MAGCWRMPKRNECKVGCDGGVFPKRNECKVGCDGGVFPKRNECKVGYDGGVLLTIERSLATSTPACSICSPN